MRSGQHLSVRRHALHTPVVAVNVLPAALASPQRMAFDLGQISRCLVGMRAKKRRQLCVVVRPRSAADAIAGDGTAEA
jgi:hypothetical protein